MRTSIRNVLLTLLIVAMAGLSALAVLQQREGPKGNQISTTASSADSVTGADRAIPPPGKCQLLRNELSTPTGFDFFCDALLGIGFVFPVEWGSPALREGVTGRMFRFQLSGGSVVLDAVPVDVEYGFGEGGVRGFLSKGSTFTGKDGRQLVNNTASTISFIDGRNDVLFIEDKKCGPGPTGLENCGWTLALVVNLLGAKYPGVKLDIDDDLASSEIRESTGKALRTVGHSVVVFEPYEQ